MRCTWMRENSPRPTTRLLPGVHAVIVCLLLVSGQVEAQCVTNPWFGQDAYCGYTKFCVVRSVTDAKVKFEVTYTHTGPAHTASPERWPHALVASVVPPATIVGVNPLSVTSGLWTASQISPIGGGMGWGAQVSPFGQNVNAIPVGASVTFPVEVSCISLMPGDLTLLELYNQADSDSWMCKLVVPDHNFVVEDATLCAGQQAILKLSDTYAPSAGLPAGAVVEWWQSTSYPCPASPPGTPGDWVLLPQTNGTCLVTAPLQTSACIAAVVKTGCHKYLATPGMVEVCSPLNSIGPLGANPMPWQSPDDGAYRACGSYVGKLVLPTSTVTCLTSVNWTITADGVPYWANSTTVYPGMNQVQSQVFTLEAPPLPQCSREYACAAHISNACGNATRTFTVHVDRPTDPGRILAQPGYEGTGNARRPRICYDDDMALVYSGGCGKVTRWEYRERLPDGWTPWATVAGAGGNSWNTNRLQHWMRYRVWVKNGACPEKHSSTMTVRVKPELKVHIEGPGHLCGATANLTAVTNYTTPQMTYEWKRNGLLLPVSTQTVNALMWGPGRYRVTVSENGCGPATAKHRVCCKQRVRIVGPCGVCIGNTVKLEAHVRGGCKPFTYAWSKNGLPLPNTDPFIIVGPGTYQVTVKQVDNPECKVTSPPFTVVVCPPIGSP